MAPELRQRDAGLQLHHAVRRRPVGDAIHLRETNNNLLRVQRRIAVALAGTAQRDAEASALRERKYSLQAGSSCGTV